MVTPAPVRIARKSTMSSPLVKAANKIVTSPTFAKARSLDFDKKNEYEKFIKFIETSNQELLKIQLPSKEDVMKSVEGRRGGGGGLLNSFIGGVLGTRLLNALSKFKPIRSLRRFLLPRRFRARLRKLRMDILRPFRKLELIITPGPG